MTEQVYPKLRFLNRIEQCSDPQPESEQGVPAQEQFSGAIPLRNERPAAELLAERLAEADPASPSLLFIP